MLHNSAQDLHHSHILGIVVTDIPKFHEKGVITVPFLRDLIFYSLH